MPYMKAAQKLYQKKGFEYIERPMGSTGHTSCSVWMIKTL
jgi:putative acetyltransferase